MKTKTFLTACGVVAVVTVMLMLFVPPVASAFEGLVLLFLGTFAT